MNTDSDKINEAFNRDLQQQIEGKLSKGYIYRLGMPGEALLSSGVEYLPVEIAASTLSLKSSKEYKSDHPFALSDVINLPNAIYNPIAIFDSCGE